MKTNPQKSAENCDNGNLTSKAEPKFKRGEKVCYNGYVYEIEGLVGNYRYALKGYRRTDEGLRCRLR